MRRIVIPSLDRRTVVVVVGGAATLLLLVWGFLAGRKEAGLERERERPVAAPTRVALVDGETAVILDAKTFERSGIMTAPVQATASAEALRAYGNVVELQQLSDLFTRYTEARAQVEKARAAVDASRREYERMRILYADNQNVSAKALQAAEAAYRADQASFTAAAAPLRTIAAAARQDWGPVLATWMLGASPEFQRLLSRQTLLIQATLPPDVFVNVPPRTASVRAGNGPQTAARLVSIAARTDPRIQGQSFFYLAPTVLGLLPGMSVTVFMAAGTPTMQSVLIPGSAVVWLQGSAWAYFEVATRAFARRRITADIPGTGGGYIVRDLAIPARVVVRGAQMLLSEEFRAQVHVGEEQK